MKKILVLLSLLTVLLTACNMNETVEKGKDISFSMSSAVLLNDIDFARDAGNTEYTVKVIARDQFYHKSYSSEQSFTPNPDRSPTELKFILKNLPVNTQYLIGVYVFCGDQLIMASKTQANIVLEAGNNKIEIANPTKETVEYIELFSDDYYFEFSADYINFVDSIENISDKITLPQAEEQYISLNRYDSSNNLDYYVYNYLRYNDVSIINIKRPSGTVDKIQYNYEESVEIQSVNFYYAFNEEGIYTLYFTLTDDLTGLTRTVTKYVNVGSQYALYSKGSDGTMLLSFGTNTEEISDPVGNVIDYTFGSDGSIYYLYKNEEGYFVKNSINTDINMCVTCDGCTLMEITCDKSNGKVFVTGIENSSLRTIEIDLNLTEDTNNDGKVNGEDQLNHYMPTTYRDYRTDIVYTAAENGVFYVLQINDLNSLYIIDGYPEELSGTWYNSSGRVIAGTSFDIPKNPSSGANGKTAVTINDFIANNKSLYITYSQSEEGASNGMSSADYNYGGLISHKIGDIQNVTNFVKKNYSVEIPRYAKYPSDSDKLSIYNFRSLLEDQYEEKPEYLWKETLNCMHSTGANANYFLNPRRIIGASGNTLIIADCGTFIGQDSDNIWYYQNQQKIAAFDTTKNVITNKNNQKEFGFGETIPNLKITSKWNASFPTTANQLRVYVDNEWKEIKTASGVALSENYWDIEER